MVYGSRVGIFAEFHWPAAKLTKILSISIPFDLVSNYITTKIKERTGVASQADKPDTDFLSQLLTRLDAGKLHYGDLFNSLGANIAAGSDTTAISLSSVFYHLLRNHDKLQRLQEEVDTFILGRSTSEPITYRESQEMAYLQACIKEALRLHPATGYPLLRIVPRGGVKLAGQFFPEGVCNI